MAGNHPNRTRPLTDWVILIFVLVVMGLLIADLADNVRDAVDQPVSTSDAATTDAKGNSQSDPIGADRRLWAIGHIEVDDRPPIEPASKPSAKITDPTAKFLTAAL